MASLPKGILRVLAWFDSTADELKALINDDGRMPVAIDEQNVDLGANLKVYDSSAWVKSPILWGYTDRWVEQVYVPNAILGTNTLNFVSVPAGYVYVALGMNAVNVNNISDHQHVSMLGGYYCKMAHNLAVGANITTYSFPLRVILKEGDNMRAVFNGCTANDDLYSRVWGYKMSVSM